MVGEGQGQGIDPVAAEAQRAGQKGRWQADIDFVYDTGTGGTLNARRAGSRLDADAADGIGHWQTELLPAHSVDE